MLATYDHPHLGAWAAITTRAYGAGRITVVGTVPGLDLAAALARWLVPTPLAGWADLPAERHRPQLDPTGRQRASTSCTTGPGRP